MYPALPKLDTPFAQAHAAPVEDQTAASSSGGGNQPSRRLAEFKTGLNVWVNQASNAERTGRLEAVRRIQHYLDKGEKSPHLDLSKLSLSTLPNDVDVLAMLAILRGAQSKSGAINLSDNPLDVSTRQVLAQQPAGRRDVFQVSVPEASSDSEANAAGAAMNNQAVGGQARGGSSHVAWICNLTNVVGVLQDHTLPALERLAKASAGVFNNPISTLSQAVSVYTQQRTKALSEVDRTNRKGLITLPDLVDLNLVNHLSGLGRLHRLAEVLTNARESLDSAVPSLAFKMNLLTTGNPVKKAKDELLALGGTVTTIEHLLTALHDCPRKASALLERVFELQNRLDDLQRKSLQLEVRGESAGDSLMQLAGLLIEYTSTLGALYRELDQQVGQYKNLAEQLPIGWPLKAHLQQWLQGKAEAVADLQQHKNLALLLGRLANPSAGSDVQAYAHTRLAGMVSTLPAGSPYLELLAKHPNEQVRGLVPVVVPALVPEPAQPTEPATDPAPAGLKRTPSETASAQFPAVNLPHTALAKVRYTAPAFEAVRQGDLAKLHEYLTFGLNPLVTNDSGDTLLHTAAQHGQVTVLGWLATVQKLPLEVDNKRGLTPLEVAFINGKAQAVVALVDAGADLQLLAKYPNKQVRAILPEPQMEPAQPTEPETGLAAAGLKRTPSEAALAQFPAVIVPHTVLAKVHYTTLAFEAVKQGDLAKLHTYLSLGLNPLVANDSGDTLLHTAAQHGQVTVLRWLATVQKLPLEVGNMVGYKPLHSAVCSGQLQAMAALVDLGADKYARDNHGNQAIHLAAMFSHADAVKFCRDELGQSLQACGRGGNTPLCLANEKGNLGTIRWLVAQGAAGSIKNRPLFWAKIYSKAIRQSCTNKLGHTDMTGGHYPPRLQANLDEDSLLGELQELENSEFTF